MDVLEYLKMRQNELERVNHPFCARSISFRYSYAFGVGVLALGSMKAITELKEAYDYFLECIALPQEQRDKIITDINNHFEFRLNDCIKVLKTKEVQYCFLADLCHLQQQAVWAMEYCDKVIENYRQIFHMTASEMQFIREFIEAAQKKQLETARRCYRNFRSNGFEIAYQVLQYFYPEYTDEDRYQDIYIESGKTLVLDKPTTVNGTITVERGGSLLVNGADITMRGSVLVDGGRIQICNARLDISECSQPFFLTVRDAAVVKIENAAIDCREQCGFLTQKSGRLLIEESEFFHSANERMIAFDGKYMQIKNTSFLEGSAGFLSVFGASQAWISHCDFCRTYAEYGGAVYSESIDNVTIDECSFRQCKAKYLGAAVYFKYLKLGQQVKRSAAFACEPEENAIFNASGKAE